MMIKKHDELVCLHKEKQKKLAQLYSELDGLTHLNLVEDVAHIEVKAKLAIKA